MADENERMQILDMIERGHITAEEGLRLLEALTAGDEPALEENLLPVETAAESSPAVLPGEGEIDTEKQPPARNEVAEAVSAEEPAAVGSDKAGEGEPKIFMGEKKPTSLPPYAEKWRRFWMVPLWIGVGITVLGGLLMYSALQASGIGFWFVCAAVPLALGLLCMVLAWQSRTAPWLHLRVNQKPGEWPERIAISFPIPVRPTAWLLRRFGHRIPKLEETSLDEIVMALGDKTSPENPLYIQVDEGEDGEQVEIYIG